MAPRVVGIGELLWDIYPGGRRLGGAPANFAYHASRLGCAGAVVSRVGDDPLGREALRRLSDLGVESGAVQVDPRLPTGTVTVTLDPHGHPTYAIHPDVAWDALEWTPALAEAAAGASAICFGTLASRGPRTLETVRRFLEAAPPGCLRIFDVNLRQDYHTPERVRAFLKCCDVLKLNEDELPQVADMCGAGGDPLEELRRRYGLKLVALTLGSRGSVLQTAEGRLEEPGAPVEVVDTVGAGDAFTAALVSGLVQGQDLPTAHRRAARLSAYVCTQEGAMPETRDY
ncbi:carbohydrate kinase family protein [Mesoterricola silvestris]|uniref:Fructokinase n=1 Tax=Mesoterricola silvestris TaxID=2927979 RepID=A0AA48KC42_9BACT|nr:carbohydrate kinase [Mesoterricola silvestris]BDU74962.1 fructokinase [Mesoterricola silvestris]